MEVSRVRALRGPNLWCRQTVIEAIVACTESECVIEDIDVFETRMRVRFPELDILKPPGHEQPGSIAHALASAALCLQTKAGCVLTYSRTALTIDPGVYQVVVEYSEEAVGLLAFELAQELCLAALYDSPFDVNDALARLRAVNDDERLGPSTGSIVQAAVKRNIPYRRLTRGSLVQFGWGSRQRRIQAAETDRSGAIAESIAQDKELTKSLLAAAGVPVPQGRLVDSAEDAWAAACELGGPVVLKPRDGNQGKGVAVNVQGREQVLAAYEGARANCRDVIVERYFPGHDFRLLVVGDKLVAAARRDPPQVTGDGEHTILELVELINADPLRGEGHGSSLTKIKLDDTALATMAAQGYRADSIPSQGTLVTLRNNANLSTGGTATDVTDHVHPELAAGAVAAAQMVGLDICGLDFVSHNVYEPLDTQQGCIVEVNAAPGLRMHLSPSFGKGRDVGEAIIDEMFETDEDGRIPLVAVAGTNGKTTTVRLIAHLIAHSGRRVGMTNSDGVYIGAKRIDTGDCSGPRSARNVLLHPDVDAAVFETARGGILREGLGFDRCNVGVVTNVGMGDHLGLSYISTVEDLAIVKRVIVENVAPDGVAVLNAADPMVVAMADNCPGAITYFCADRQQSVLAMHRAQGRRVVCVEEGAVLLAEGDFEQRFALNAIPLTHNGTIGFQVENVMAALGAAWALKLEWDDVRQGLASFVSDADTAPGRFNLFPYGGATVIADYGHNPDAIQALVNAIDTMPAKRRSVVISGAGDRRDVDIRRQTEILGDAFHDVILYQDMCQRGRTDGEVVALLREGLANAVLCTHIQEVRGEFLAIDTALARLADGDLCLILVDQVEEALAHIAQRVADRVPSMSV
ncbi:cyanophycin synthetase [Pollutimonas nitritireducens]|uniref:Cyanophycin synthetase n=1 Tax=Pollutimonas nitritireducens TaxID=2045209 RepID=A0A2N4ULE0_9BURK|nr:cyanophycin synthetase [Pollutimonas nitritireducens]PLC55831.1 cyanophycin synthetase [Pollutimonas nitritireducens]